MKKTWDTIKQVIGKTKTIKNDIPKRMVIDGIETFDQNKVANGFNKYFTCIFNPSLFQSFQTVHERLKNSVTGIHSSRLRIRRSF